MDPRRKRLLYRATHCGMKENDVLIGRFTTAHVEELSEKLVDQLENLMNHTDNDLYNWIMGRQPTPEFVDSDVLRMVKKYNGTL